jgi:exosortase
MSVAVTSLGGRWSPAYAALLAGCGGLACLPVFFWAAEIWMGGLLGGAAAGILTLPICMVLSSFAVSRPAWKRDTLDRPGADWALAGVAVWLLGGLLWAGTEWDALIVAGVALPPAAWVWSWGLLGWSRAKALTLPILFAWFALPWEHFLRRSLDTPLQSWTADISFQLLSVAGYPMRYWKDYTIWSDAYYVIVNETCSGMNMLVTLSMYTLIFGWIAQPSFRNRLLLLTLVVPLAMLANGVRVAVIYLLGHYGGREWADGFWHTGSAYVIFLPVFWFLYVINGALTRRWAAARAAARRAPA